MKQRFTRSIEKAQDDVYGANRRLEIIKKVASNCESIRDSERNCRLLDANARGCHLEDPVYQKLIRASLRSIHLRNGYLLAALQRIGNRTMTEKEYSLLEEIPGVQLEDYPLDKRLIAFDNRKGVEIKDGPFFFDKPRDRTDYFREAQKVGYNRGETEQETERIS